MWINNLTYWGCNQYIIQRALGANLKTAQHGLLFAAFLKLLVPVIVVLPGIAMFVLHKNGLFRQEMMPQESETGSRLSDADESASARIEGRRISRH